MIPLDPNIRARTLRAVLADRTSERISWTVVVSGNDPKLGNVYMFRCLCEFDGEQWNGAGTTTDAQVAAREMPDLAVNIIATMTQVLAGAIAHHLIFTV